MREWEEGQGRRGEENVDLFLYIQQRLYCARQLFLPSSAYFIKLTPESRLLKG